ncbi:MAG: hypothetical protein B9S32_00035 [Verrucomicrobia bacterium Tous-C9LFEB]|nr:MAG: hypothetical protein B9S32_00035 [Verrucomicrobia bacterium Tous-C9LFEB]
MNANSPTTPPTEPFDGHYAAITHWRGVAVLMILLSHTALGGNPESTYPGQGFLYWLAQFGTYGIDLFVVLSGYCIASHVCHLVQTGQQPLSFLRHRFLRLYPIYWIACALTVALGVAGLNPFFEEWHRALPSQAHAAIANFLLIEINADALPLLPASQPLIYGVGIYLLVGLGFWFYRMGCPVHLLIDIGLGLAVIALFQIRFLPLYVLQLWPEFTMGGLLFLALYYQRFSRFHEGLCLTGIAGLAAASWLLSNRHMAMLFSFTAAFALMLYYLHRWDQPLSQARILHPLRWIGSISYSLYLILDPLSISIATLVRRYAQSLVTQPAALQLLLWGGCLLGGWLFYQLCEKPLEKWRHSLRPPQGQRDDLIFG